MFGRGRRGNSRYTHTINEQRQQKDRFFVVSPNSPLPHEERHKRFTGLAYYPPDPVFHVTVEIVPLSQPEIVQLATSTGEIRPQARYAELRFRLGGQQFLLYGFANPHERHTHELFVPFRDATSGRETYGPGRYLDVALDHPARRVHMATLDFNLAYNPYCAYSPNYSCPIPPAENTLPIAITAGERTYDGGGQARHQHMHIHHEQY